METNAAIQTIVYQGGEDLRQKPDVLFRIPIDAGPVLLRQ